MPCSCYNKSHTLDWLETPIHYNLWTLEVKDGSHWVSWRTWGRLWNVAVPNTGARWVPWLRPVPSKAALCCLKSWTGTITMQCFPSPHSEGTVVTLGPSASPRSPPHFMACWCSNLVVAPPYPVNSHGDWEVNIFWRHSYCQPQFLVFPTTDNTRFHNVLGFHCREQNALSPRRFTFQVIKKL